MSKTDEQKLIDLFDEWGVVYTYHKDAGAVVIEANDGPKNKGYSGFYVEFDFAPDGSFDYLGVWE